MPQLPQFFGSMAGLTSQPSTMLSLQSMKPCAQVFVQEEPSQVVPGQP
jgi:hypothetical protein